MNPNPNFFFHPLPLPPPPPLPPTTAATQTADLSATLASLTHLLSLSHKTFNSLFPLLSQITPSNPTNSDLVPCPYNSHHLMPPESLFLHFLRCPFPLSENLSSVLESLHYPKTLDLQNLPKFPFNPSVQGPGDRELCLSLDVYCCEFGSSFFYRDCPGVVDFNALNVLNKSLTLPGVLLAECGNFVRGHEGMKEAFDENGLRVLPSELWAVRREIDSWVDYPRVYSYGVFCSIMMLNEVKESDLKGWIIGSSPRYGVVIDVYMRDHLSVLFRLCLKAIRREALASVDSEMSMKASRLKCPVLFQVLTWLASQLSILYGEVNGKSFAIHIFKQCVLSASNGVVLVALESSLTRSSRDLDAKLEDPVEGSTESNASIGMDRNVDEGIIFVPQVAAVIAALHERSMLEAKIKALRCSQTVPCYQRVIEHEYVSKRADEERKQRLDYKAIIEHDSLLRKRSSDQDTNKIKTREELLAEERDYKRRRMSYRGKKVKRTAIEVMRDMIEEYTEEIKQAGGIGCFEKGSEEERMPLEPPSARYVTSDADKLHNRSDESSVAMKHTSNQDSIHSHSCHNIRSPTPKDSSPHHYERHRQGSHDRRKEHLEYRSTSRDRHGREYYSRSPERDGSRGRLHERSGRRRERDDVGSTRTNGQERSSVKSNYPTFKSSYSVPDSANNFMVQDDDQKLDAKDRSLRSSRENRRSNILAENLFADRYDPEESYETLDADVYSGSKNARPEKFRE